MFVGLTGRCAIFFKKKFLRIKNDYGLFNEELNMEHETCVLLTMRI